MKNRLAARQRGIVSLCFAMASLVAPSQGSSMAAFAEGGQQAPASFAPRTAASLPALERFVYTRSVGGKVDRLDIELTLKNDRGRAWRELISKAPDEDAVYTLDAVSLALLRSDVTTRTATTTIHRVTEVLEDRLVLAPDELQLSATEPFRQSLRLIAFEAKPVYRLSFQGGSGLPGFSLVLSVLGRERIEAGGRSWDCWKVEVGAKGLIGTLFGKSHYWYEAEWPHVLVSFEGPSSFPGSPMTRLELLSYSAP